MATTKLSSTRNRPHRQQPQPATRDSLRQRVETLLATECAYIHSRQYERLTIATLEAERPENMYSEQASFIAEGSSGIGLATGLDVRLLSHEGEVYLFRRMNFFHFRANLLRSKLDPARPQKRVIEDLEQALLAAQQTRADLVQANVRLVAGLAHKFAHSRVEYEDLLSEGNLILLNAIDKFDIDRGFRFSTYATHAVQRHFYRVIQRRQRRQVREVSSSTEQFANSIPQPEPAEEVQYDPQVTAALIEQFAIRLDDREQQILASRYDLGGAGKGKTLKAIATEMGLSKERVRQLQYRALDKLREAAVELNLAPATSDD